MAQYCPQCLVEYRDGFTECTECQVALVAGPSPEPPPVDHALHLVTVLTVVDSLTLTLAKTALDEAGIDYEVEGDDPASTGIPGMFGAGATPLGVCSCSILVSREAKAAASVLLEPFQGPVEVEPEVPEQVNERGRTAGSSASSQTT